MALSTAGFVSCSIGGTVFAADPAGSKETFDRKVTRLEMANGSRFNTVDFYDSDSEAKVVVSLPLCVLAAGQFPGWGLGATVGDPQPTDVVFTLPNEKVSCLQYLLNSWEVTFTKGKAAMLALEYHGTTPPAYADGEAPAVAADTTYVYFKDITAFDTIATAGATGVREFKCKLMHNLYADYSIRADGLALPTSLTPTTATVEGSLTMVINGVADLLAFAKVCQVPANISLTAVPFCDGGGTFICSPQNCVYDKPERGGSIKEAATRTFTYYAKNKGGANPLVCTF